MRLASLALIAALALVPVAACGDHGHGGEYDSLQDCVTDHLAEGLPENQALATCLVDHSDVELATLEECLAYVTANGGYPESRQAACEDYLEEHGAH